MNPEFLIAQPTRIMLRCCADRGKHTFVYPNLGQPPIEKLFVFGLGADRTHLTPGMPAGAKDLYLCGDALAVSAAVLGVGGGHTATSGISAFFGGLGSHWGSPPEFKKRSRTGESLPYKTIPRKA